MEPWVLWLLAVALLGLAEPLTLTLALGLLAIAALSVVRPVARRHVRQPPPLRTGTAALVEGSEAVTPPYELAPGEEWPAEQIG
ncbi:hypothetical protein ACIBF1_02295 [Spirillospora sp. NPDC050679]